MFNPLTDFEDLSGKVIIITTRVRSDFHSYDRSHSFLAKRLVMPQLNTLLAPVLMYISARGPRRKVEEPSLNYKKKG